MSIKMANLINIPWLTESIKKCSIKYLIERYLGHYISGELDLSQLNFDIFSGKGSVDLIPLDADTINEEMAPFCLPFTVNRAFIQGIEVFVPWSSLLRESCHVHLTGARFRFNKIDKSPNKPADVSASSVFAKSLTASSIEIAEDIVVRESEKFDGLEKFAQLINHVIRRFKLSAYDTHLRFDLPGDNRYLEFIIAHINCEEEEISLENNDKNNETAEFCDVMTKCITVEGIDVYMNGALVTKLYGKHTIKLRFDKDRLDTEAYLGSYIFAILNSDQLKVLRELFTFESGPNPASDIKMEKPMTSQDYQKIQELMHGYKNEANDFDTMSSSMKGKNWTSDGENYFESEEPPQFKPFTTTTTFGGSSESLQTKIFTCNLKIPGIMLCLISKDSQSPVFNNMPKIDSLQTFIGINSFLNELLVDFDHLRILASNLCLDLTNDRLQFSCINVSAYEFFRNSLSNILLVKDSDCEEIVPSVKIKVSGNTTDIELASTVFKLDLTLIERHYYILQVFLPSNDQPSDSYHHNVSDKSFIVNVECKHLEADLYFPIPDLRKRRDDLSELHEETLYIVLTDVQLRVDGPSISLVCCSAEADMKINDRSRRVFSSKCDSPDISFNLSFLDPQNSDQYFNSENYLFSRVDSMQESINFFTPSTINRNKSNSAFQVKRKLFGEEENNSGHEQIVTPGDRDHLQNYLTFNKEKAKMCIYINFPHGDIYLEDKAMLELIYNRFVNDLALWTPFYPWMASSAVQNRNGTNQSTYQPTDDSMKDIMKEAISSAIYQSAIDTSYAQSSRVIESHIGPIEPPLTFPFPSEQSQFYSCRGQSIPMQDDSCDSEVSFHSLDEGNNEMIQTVVNNFLPKAPENGFVLELEIGTLNAKFNTGKGAENVNNLFSQNFLLGLVLGPEDDPSTVVCLSLEQLIMKHCDKHVLIGNSYMESSGSVLNMALEIRREDDRLKKIKLALQLHRALMLGLDLPIFDELYDFAMLVDEDIKGYICPKVILELHIDIAQSGISFDLLKERTTLLHVEDIYLTSMVIENTAQTILRFLIDEALLCFKRNNVCSETMKSYIPVIDTGIIDLNLKLSKNGKLELKVTNNEINVKVCPDSLASLAQFLQLFAEQLLNESDDKPVYKPTQNKGEDIFVRKNAYNGSDLIADALFECSNEQSEHPRKKAHEGERLLSLSDDEDDARSNDSLNMDSNNLMCQNCDSPKIDESTFWILGDDDVGTGINFSKEPQVRQLISEPLRVIENHFKLSNHNLIPEISSSTIMRYLLERLSLKFSLFGGRDFDDVPSEEMEEHRSNQSKLDVVSQANLSIRSGKLSQKVRFQQNSVVWENIDLMSHNGTIHRDAYSIQNGVTKEPILNFKSSGGRNRKNDTCVELKLNRIKTLFENFDSQHSMAWRFMLFIQEIQILDKVNASKIKTLLYEYVSETIPRRKNSNMFSIHMTCHRNFMDKNEECNLHVSLKPLRINIDQDTLIFLMEFVTQTSEILTAKLEQTSDEILLNQGKNCDTGSMLNDEMPILSTGALLADARLDEDELNFSSNVDIELSKSPPSSFPSESARVRHASSSSTSSSADKIFIKSFVFAPDVPIRLDYHGKHIDFKQGAIPGIFLGLAQLNQSELYLKRLVNKHGLLGLDKVIAYAFEEWARDIKRNQLPSILGGVGPMHSFIKLFQGCRDLFWMPIDQYRKDQRIVRGLQRGAHAFSVSTAMATLELTNRFVSLIQTTAQFTHDVVTPPVPSGAYRSFGGQLSTFHNSQPRDFREGVTVAYTVMREGFHDTVRGVTNAGLVSDDMSTVIGEVVRQIPSTLVRPFIHVSQATSSMLVGMRNQLTPEARKDDHEKWKNANER